MFVEVSEFCFTPSQPLPHYTSREEEKKRRERNGRKKKEKKDTQSYHLIVGAGVKFKSKPNIKILTPWFIIITNIR